MNNIPFKQKSFFKSIFFILMTMTLTACGSIPEPDAELISNFSYQELDEGDDAGIYLIRPNQFVGGGRDYWVAVDDKVIGDLNNNAYVFLSLNSKENSSINTVIDMAGQNFIGVSEGGTVDQYYFYSVDLTSWIPKKLSDDVGKTMVSGMREHKLDYVSRPNHGFDNLSMNPGMVTEYMRKKTQPLEPDSDYGVVYFFRPEQTTESMNLAASIWTKDKHLGSIKAKQYFAVKMPVGKHKLYRRDGDFRTLNIEVEANRFHYVKLDQSLGFTAYNYKPVYIGSEDNIENQKVVRWLDTLEGFEPIPDTQWNSRQVTYVDRGLEFIQKHKHEFSDQ
ncbi:hypothetical protein JCM19241_4856 [Vibrio ishigakensis]|uniref:Uncharacterized protein n=1 Tax=Vibrio ishigakensis TaxID=1481914 RepID=A0A0B8QHW5_9VIBR|nr:hypothetical protein JCM19241_4856 [Vibrio ishigakensis]